MPDFESIDINLGPEGVAVQTAEDMPALDHRVIDPRQEIEIELDYPLETPLRSKRHGAPRGWTPLDLLLEVRAYYAEIYEGPEENGIYGHEMGDLYIQALVRSADGVWRAEMSS